MLGGVALASGSAKGPFGNPDAGLSDAQRNAKYEAARAAFEARYAAWVQNLDVSTLDLSSLPHVALNVNVEPGQPTLSAAKQKSDVIVIATASGLQPTTSGTIVTLSVERAIKGSVSQSISVLQASGLRPTQDWQHVVIADSPGEPLILPGTRLELFLENAGGGPYQIQSVTGMYYLESGYVRPLALNPFAPSLTGLTEGAFLDATLA
jgi:hypothetical protein